MPPSVMDTDWIAPRNQVPDPISSPAQASSCCFAAMEEVGPAAAGDHWVYRFQRCRTCCFTIRVVVPEIPDEALVASLRTLLSTAFQRTRLEE